MKIKNVFMTFAVPDSPLDASGGAQGKAQVSDFLTVQSFANFAAMTGAITGAWNGLQRLTPYASTLWVPYGCAFAWAVISVVISLDGLRKSSSSSLDLGTLLQAIFLGLINSLVLAGAVVGTNIVTR